MKPKAKKPTSRPHPGLGFPFTPADNRLIFLARIAARQFMESYGKGRQPFDIDPSHYIS